MANLNAVKRPWHTFWRRRGLRPQDRWILPALNGYAEGLVQDKGGPDEITAGECRMVEIAQVARGCMMLIMAEAGQRGFTIPGENGKGWDLHPGVKELAKFLHLERNALINLGLERKAKAVGPLNVVRYALAPSAAPPDEKGGE